MIKLILIVLMVIFCTKNCDNKTISSDSKKQNMDTLNTEELKDKLTEAKDDIEKAKETYDKYTKFKKNVKEKVEEIKEKVNELINK